MLVFIFVVLMLSVNLKERQVSGSDVMLKAIVDDAVGFRIRVRQFALALDQTQLSKVLNSNNHMNIDQNVSPSCSR